MAGEHKLKVEDKYFDSLADHVQGMIDDLQDGVGMGNSKDGSFGDEQLADKVDLFEKHWHQQAKPNLIDHLGKLKKHIETTRSEIQAMERKLAAEARAQHPPAPTHHSTPAPPPATTPKNDNGYDPNNDYGKTTPPQYGGPAPAPKYTEAERAQAWYAYDHGYTDIPPKGIPRP